MTAVFELQKCVVSNVHPSWLFPMTEDLVAQCKKQERGRRWIAELLSDGIELINTLMNRELAAGLECDPLQGFWIDPKANWDSLVIHRLGAMVYAPAIIKVVNGQQVRAISSALGRDLYASTLKYGRANLNQTDLSDNELRNINFDLDGRWFLDLQLEGFKQLAGFAFRRHPLLLERVKIVQDKAFCACTPKHFNNSRLQDKLIEECILEVMQEAAGG